MHTIRQHHAARGLWMIALAGSALLAACNTDQFLRARDPDNTPPGVLKGPQSLPAYRASAVGDFAVGFDGNAGGPDGNEYEGLVNMTGLFTDEFFNTETFPTRLEVDRRNINPDNSTMLPIFFNIEAARVSANRAATAFAAYGPNDPGYSEVESLQAYAILLMAEAYCSGVPLSNIDTVTSQVLAGTPLTTTQLLQTAVDTFAFAQSLATNASSQDMEFLARIGQARALLQMGRNNLPAAAALVQAIPDDWVYLVHHSKTSQREWNGVYEFMWLEGRWVESENEGGNGLGYLDDPRTPFLFIPGGTFVGPPFDFYGTLKYSAPDSSVVLASGIEARLIEAEAALDAGDNSTFLSLLNQLRSESNLGLAPLADPGSVTGRQDLLFSERAFWMYGTAHRLGDLRRMVRQYGRDPETVFPTGAYGRGGAYGTDVNFPIPVEETNNPNLGGPGSPTCLDRNP